ncbi:MAG: shikimate kinase [Gammaproteobacteria bacterium]
MKAKGNIFLIGMMGVGKTTIGKKLATYLNMEFYDSDAEIEKHTKATVSWIFELEGEGKFREREIKMIDWLTQQKNIVLATGGGAILSPDNRHCLKERGLVIYLHADPNALIKRTRQEGRPLLSEENPYEVFVDLLAKREPLYKEIAQFSYDTGQNDLSHVVRQIINDLRSNKYVR